MKFNRHIEEPVKSHKLAENLGYFFFRRVYICASCLHINKFFFVHSYDPKVLRNQIWCTNDNFFTFKIFHFDLPSKMSKKKNKNHKCLCCATIFQQMLSKIFLWILYQYFYDQNFFQFHRTFTEKNINP